MQGQEINLRNLVIYEIYVRNHGPNGTFDDVRQDLGRIKAMGVDVIWLMPIHPIGEKGKKGSLGCPYSIKDYRKVNPEYGTLLDFKKLLDEAHHRGLKVMIDIVYNHTSHDSVLVTNSPKFFHQDEHGKPITTVTAWSDVIDLKHPNPDLQTYLIDSMLYWVNLGVDGFRCDVASIIPLSFWMEAKSKVKAVKPDFIWLAESVETAWVIERRKNGLLALSDPELYQVFDLTYDYDIWPLWQAAVKRKIPVERYLEMLEFQKGIFPNTYIKMRCVENHDNLRIMALASDQISAKAWTAFQVFNQGAFLLYAGQESGSSHTPSLFDIDKIDWGNYQLQEWFTKLFSIKHQRLLSSGDQSYCSADPAIEVAYALENCSLYGIFNINGCDGEILTFLPDGQYQDLISETPYSVHHGKIDLGEKSVILVEFPGEKKIKPMDFPLLDFMIS